MAFDSGHSVNCCTDMQETPLHFAAGCGNLEIVAMFLERGANVDVRNLKGVTPLHVAASCGPASVVKALITAVQARTGDIRTSIVSAQNLRGETPLHWAVDAGLLDVVEVLVDNFSDINAYGQGQTPLWNARTKGFVDIAALLVAKGARVELQELLAILDLMGVQGDNLKDIILSNPPYSAAVGINLMLASGKVAVQEEGEASTPLHYAVSQGCIEVVKTLLRYGADINTKDSESRTCLDMCLGPWCLEPNMEIVRLLLERDDVALDTQDPNGNTLLHRAAIRNQKELVEVLVDRGANPTIRNRQGRTPARLTKNGEIEETLAIACAMQISKAS